MRYDLHWYEIWIDRKFGTYDGAYVGVLMIQDGCHQCVTSIEPDVGKNIIGRAVELPSSNSTSK